MQISVFLSDIDNPNLLKLFGDIQSQGTKYLLYDNSTDNSLSLVAREYNIEPVEYQELIMNIHENDIVEIWLYHDMLIPVINDKILKIANNISDLCNSIVQKEAKISLHIIQRGGDVIVSQKSRKLAGGIEDALLSWEIYLQLSCEVNKLNNANATIHAVPYAVCFPWEKSVSEKLVNRIAEFLYFVNSRFTGYSDIDKLHILCKNRGWKEWDYSDLISHLNGFEINEAGYSYTLKDLVDEIAGKGMPVASVSDEQDLNGIDLLFENLLDFYYPFMHELQTESDRLQIFYELPGASEVNIDLFSKMTKKTYIHSKGQINYYTIGEGEVILIINAYGVTLDAWFPLISALSKQYKVIVSEVRGMYNSEIPLFSDNKSMRLYDQVDDFVAILENENVERLHTISWCSGAKQAIMLCEMGKFEILTQTIIAGEFAPYSGSNPFHSKFRNSVQEIFALIKDDERVFDFYMKIIKKNIFTTQIPYLQFLEERQEIDIEKLIFMIIPDKYRPMILSPFESKEKMRNFLAMCVEYYQHSVEDKLQKIKVPSLILSAENDQIAHPAQSEWAASNLLNAIHVCMPHATHLMIYERYDDILSVLLPHLNKIIGEVSYERI